MRYEDKLFVGLSVEIVVHDGEYKGRYRTKIEEIGVKILSIGVPIAQRQFIPLREGTELEVTFWDDVSAYSFSSVIINRIAVPVPTFVIEHPNKIHRIQRRQYVRLTISTPFDYYVLEKEGLSKVHKGCMIDLSGGGIQFKSKNNLPPNTIIVIKITMGNTDTELSASVIRSIEAEETDHYKISAEFHEISEKTRDKIIRYIFDLQREMRKKGLI